MKLFSFYNILRTWRQKSRETNESNQHQKAVRFEDCERINRERFQSNEMTELNMRNQYFAALAGK